MSTTSEALARLASVRPTVPISGVREHGGGDVVVIDRPRRAAEQPVGERMALADRDRRQIDAVGHVADGVDRGHVACVELASTTTAPSRVERDAGRLQPEARACSGARPVAIST